MAYKQNKGENHMNISIDAEKAFDIPYDKSAEENKNRRNVYIANL
jgi:hypothetical protein